MLSMTNPEASVKKNISIKFKNEGVDVTHGNDPQQFLLSLDSHRGNDYKQGNDLKPDNGNGSPNNRSRSRSRSSRSRSRSSRTSSHDGSRSRDRSRSDSYDRNSRRNDRSNHRRSRSRSRSYSSSSSASPHRNVGKSPLKRSGNFGDKIMDWNFSIGVAAERIQDPNIFVCDICRLPVINYGRLLPCKHIFCYPCALKMNLDEKQSCTKCRNAISNVELCPPGVLFVCTFGGSKVQGGCRRAYRSSEDLQTHANQRHNGSVGTAVNEAGQPCEPASLILSSIVPSVQPTFSPVQNVGAPGGLYPVRQQSGFVAPLPATFPTPMMAQAAALQQAFQNAGGLFHQQNSQQLAFSHPGNLVFRASSAQQGQAAQPNPLLGLSAGPQAAFFMAAAASMMNSAPQQSASNSMQLLPPTNVPPPPLVFSTSQAPPSMQQGPPQGSVLSSVAAAGGNGSLQ